MRIEISAAAIILAAGVMLMATAASAGGYGCASAECYEKVRRPDVYATVERPVVVRPGYAEVVHVPPAVLDRVRRVGSCRAASTSAVSRRSTAATRRP